MPLRVGIDRELARAEFRARIHCLVFVVPLEHDPLANAFSVFDCWPENFHLFLDQVRSLSKSSKRHTTLQGGFWRYLPPALRFAIAVAAYGRDAEERISTVCVRALGQWVFGEC